jgi:hypothetical protein
MSYYETTRSPHVTVIVSLQLQVCISEMFGLLRNVFEKLVHLVNGPHILKFNVSFSQSAQFQ